MSELGTRILAELGDSCAPYRALASALGETPDRVKRACATLRRNGEIRIEYVEMNGCIRLAMVMKMDGKNVVMKNEKAPDGAYRMGQTDLDGGMVVETGENFVIKERAPWKSTME